jgi:hypothetical protein
MQFGGSNRLSGMVLLRRRLLALMEAAGPDPI